VTGDVYDISKARMVQALRALHRPFGVYDSCGHEHRANDAEAMYVDEIGWTCEAGLTNTICEHCCVQPNYGQSEECATDHKHGPDIPICPTMAIIEGKPAPTGW
jgi:hypothetical protein